MLTIDRTALDLQVDIAIEPEFDFRSEAYRTLFAASSNAPFQAPLWQAMIHERLLQPLNARQHTLTIRDRKDRALLAVIPLVLQKSRGVSLLQAADFGLCDFNSAIGAPRVLDTLAQTPSVLDRIAQLTKTGDLFLYRKVRADGFDTGRLFAHAAASPAENAAYHLDIDEDFSHWRRRTISRSFSKELGQLGRQLEAEHGTYDTHLATTTEEIHAAFDFLWAARDGQFDDDLLFNPTYFQFYRDYAVAAAATGEAATYVSTVAGRPVAVLFGLQSDGNFHAVQLGHDATTLGKFSLGSQIIYRTIKLRHDQGHRSLDMGLGNTGYKSHFRVEQTLLNHYSRANSLPGLAVNTIYTRAKPLKNWLKRLTPVR